MGSNDFHLILEYLFLDDCGVFWLHFANLKTLNLIIGIIAGVTVVLVLRVRVFDVIVTVLVDIGTAIVLRVALVDFLLRLNGFLAIIGDLLVLSSGTFFFNFVVRVGGLGRVLFG